MIDCKVVAEGQSSGGTKLVTVADAGLGVTVDVAGAVQVASPPITAFGRNFTLRGASTKFSSVVATFSDAGPALPLASYVATIAWGGGTVSVGKISGGHGVFSVQATRRFIRFTGIRTAAITVADAFGRRAFAFDQFSFAPGKTKEGSSRETANHGDQGTGSEKRPGFGIVCRWLSPGLDLSRDWRSHWHS